MWAAEALLEHLVRYRNLLAGPFMLRVLPPWFENLGKRLVRSPKVYVRDSGILHFPLGLEDRRDARARVYWCATPIGCTSDKSG